MGKECNVKTNNNIRIMLVKKTFFKLKNENNFIPVTKFLKFLKKNTKSRLRAKTLNMN